MSSQWPTTVCAKVNTPNEISNRDRRLICGEQCCSDTRGGGGEGGRGRRKWYASSDFAIGVGLPRSGGERPGNRSAPRFVEPQAATLVGLTSRSLLELVIGIARGFIASGISRTRSTCRSPFSRFAPLT